MKAEVQQAVVFASGPSVSTFPITSFGRKSDLEVGKTFLCHAGSSTDFSCGLLKDLNITLYTDYVSSNGTAGKRCNTTNKYCYNFMSMSGPDLKCEGGDSGGPITAGNAAYGIAGSCNLNQMANGSTPILYYSTLNYLNEFPVYLGVSAY